MESALVVSLVGMEMLKWMLRKTLVLLTGLISDVHQGEKLGKPQDEGSQQLTNRNKNSATGHC